MRYPALTVLLVVSVPLLIAATGCTATTGEKRHPEHALLCILPVARDPRPRHRRLPDDHSRDARTPLLGGVLSPGYGWVPNDVTVAEAADRVVLSGEKRTAFKDYYATNLDSARLTIQKNVDAPMDPALPDDAVFFRIVRQYPAVVSDTADYDIDLFCMECFSISLETVA